MEFGNYAGVFNYYRLVDVVISRMGEPVTKTPADRMEEEQDSECGTQEIPIAPEISQMPTVDPTQFLQLMFQQMQRASIFPQPVHVDYLALALPHRPPTFSGDVDPVALDDWQYKLNRVFQSIGCPENRKVEVAVQFLDGPALHWWRSTEINRDEVMGWNEFIEKLRSHFFY